MVYDPNSRRMVPAAVEETEYRIREAAEKQPRRKKSTRVQKSGSHLAKGTVARPRGTLVNEGRKARDEPVEPSRVVSAPVQEKSQSARDPQSKPISVDRREARQVRIMPEDDTHSHSPEPDASRLRSPPPPQPQHVIHEQATSPQASETPSHQLPITTEESDEEDGGVLTTTPLSQKVLNALDAVPTRQKVFEQHRTAPTPIPEESDAPSESQPEPAPQIPAQPEPAAEPRKESTAPIENKHVVGLSKAGSNQSRSTSNSPVRQARFATSPSSSLSVRHHPLPRSASPIKPALKHTSAARDVSPSEAGSDNIASGDASLASREEPPVPRKKSVRVSFDDQSTKVVGESAAPVEDAESTAPPSPQQAKRPWYSNIGRNKRREIALEDDEIMKPRPALPSFGSVRDKKTRQPEERPLVRPPEPSRSPSEPSSPIIPPQSTSSPPGEMSEPQDLSLGQSSDQALGAVLTQEQASRNEANISRFREPLPPVVTSAEGLDDMSDTTLDSDQESGASEKETEITRSPLETNGTGRTDMRVEDKVLGSHQDATKTTPPSRPADEIPEISVIQPSPGFPPESLTADTMKFPLSQPQYFDVPGGFPNEYEAGRSKPTTAGAQPSVSQPASTIFEPTAEVQPAQAESLPQTTLVTATQPEISAESESDSDGNSIYSDAYEDLSDIEGGAFLSLDAVVDSPATKTATQSSDLPARVQGSSIETEAPPVFQIQVPALLQQQPNTGDWEQAKSYWRSLTAEKREQLEREALEEAGMDGDREEVAPPVRRNSRRKSGEHKQPIVDSKPQVTSEPKPSKRVTSEKVYTAQADVKADHTFTSPTAAPRSMRSSMRNRSAKDPQPQAPTSMRRSMRSGGAGQPAGSTPPRPSTSGQDRPVSMLSSNAAGSALKQSRPPLQRRGSDASDSSFKRSRPKSSSGMGFRKTMRQPDPQAPRGSGRFSLRSLSPGGSPMRRTSIMSADSGPPVSMMRRTLRSNSESSHEGRSFPSFSRSSKASIIKKSKKNGSSRFADGSEDEDDVGARPRPFRSRFDNDSDEDIEPPPPPPDSGALAKGTLRGSATAPAGFKKSITVPEAVEESPELQDSDDDHDDIDHGGGLAAMQNQHHRAAAGPRSIGTSTLTRTQSGGRGGFSTSLPSTTAAATTSPKERRGSLMSILRRSKKAGGGSGIQRSEPTESAARRDTRLERNSLHLRDLRDRDRAASPKLQKRNNSLRRGDGWPLPGEDGVEAQRPGTSAGAGAGIAASAPKTRNGSVTAPAPSFGRRNTDLGLGPVGEGADDGYSVSIASGAAASANTGGGGSGSAKLKKKKFGALRRMFRLDD